MVNKRLQNLLEKPFVVEDLDELIFLTFSLFLFGILRQKADTHFLHDLIPLILEVVLEFCNLTNVLGDHSPLSQDSREVVANFVHPEEVKFLAHKPDVGSYDAELLQSLPQHPLSYLGLEISYS